MRALRKIGLGGGAYTAVVWVALVLIAGCLLSGNTQANPVKPWDQHAIEATFAGVRVQEIDASKSAVVFLYDLENTTENDYQLAKGPAVVIMSRLKSSGSLSSEKQVMLASSAFIPARNRTRVELMVTRAFSWPGRMDTGSETRIRQLVASETADLNGFVLFDQASRYQIELPGSWPVIEKKP